MATKTFNERKWLECVDADEMLDHLCKYWRVMQRKGGPRKLQLFGCASCRLFGESLIDQRSIAAIDEFERFSDGEVTAHDLQGACQAAEQARSEANTVPLPSGLGRRGVVFAAGSAAALVARNAQASAKAHIALRSSVPPHDARHQTWLDELRELADLLREIFGNPFREYSRVAAWRTDTATAIARQMYESRDFSAMPILADALQDAGCDSDDLLNHCRDPQQVHVRGCWVLDLVLDKV